MLFKLHSPKKFDNVVIKGGLARDTGLDCVPYMGMLVLLDLEDLIMLATSDLALMSTHCLLQ
jgi:hypothetical protein